MKNFFSFPNPVNEVSARLVAGGVVLLTLVILLGGQTWAIGVLAYGFVARVLTGPTMSPLGQFVTRVLTPALPFEPKMVPGPPKRFAQGIGATLSVGAAISFAFANTTVGARARGHDHGRGDPRERLRLLPGLPDLRPAHEGRRGPGLRKGGVR